VVYAHPGALHLALAQKAKLRDEYLGFGGAESASQSGGVALGRLTLLSPCVAQTKP